MSHPEIDRPIVHAWLSARSIARGLPAPVPDHGGYRVDTNSESEIKRWVFSHLGSGLAALARSINQPRHVLKLCGDADTLRSTLPAGWRLHAPGYFMLATGQKTEQRLPKGYVIEKDQMGAVVEIRVKSGAGELAAHGYAAETQEAFIYDRIVTAPEFRRQGLGRAVMAALQHMKQRQETPELLVATWEGRALYTNLGWRTISEYSTASIAEG